MAIKTSTLETLTWVFIYGGLLMLSLSVFVSRRSDALGTTLAVAGTIFTVLGAALIVVRSRMKEPR
jgi:hypothetical protein